MTPRRATAIQRSLATQVIRRGSLRGLRLAAGADVAFLPGGEESLTAVVVWDVVRHVVVEQHVVRKRVTFPYVPGLLSFREAPAILQAIKKLRCRPDVFLFDGQGFAHPRRFGLACHVGVLMNRPSVGCAKSVLIGTYREPAKSRGAATPLVDSAQRIGTALRTRDGVKPIFVSVGHRLSLQAAVRVTLDCGGGFRLPEPTRLADKLVAVEKKSICDRG